MIDLHTLAPLKPLLTALVLPPVPFLILAAAGLRLASRQRRGGTTLAVLGLALVWLCACQGVGRGLQRALLQVPAPLTAADIAGLKPTRLPSSQPPTAIVMLGSGLIERAPETGTSDLPEVSLARLRYGIQLSRQTGLPMAYSGGLGWQQGVSSGQSEAATAQRIAEAEFLRPIRWAETASRDTRENAAFSVRLLQAAGIRRIVLVTSVWHMPRALRAFREAAGDGISIVPAPMDFFPEQQRVVFDWLPTSEGFRQTRTVLRETLGLALGF